MKAVVYDRYGPPGVLRIEEVARRAPRDEELLVRVRATTVNRLDRVYLLEDVAEAARYVETQQKIGNVVLALGDG